MQELDGLRQLEPPKSSEPPSKPGTMPSSTSRQSCSCHNIGLDPKLLDRIEELEQTLFELGGEIGAGRHVPPGVRVLTLRDNPEQQWVDLRQSVMDQLRGENDALLKRLKELEASKPVAVAQSGEEAAALVPRESWELVSKEKAELEEAVKQKEKRLLRLQQVRSHVCLLYQKKKTKKFIGSQGVYLQKPRIP